MSIQDTTIDMPGLKVMGFRRLFVNLAILIIIIGHLAAILWAAEPWPFSRYDMYAKSFSKSQTKMQLYGINGDLEIAAETRYLWPFDRSRLNFVLTQLAALPEQERLKKALRFFLNRYQDQHFKKLGRKSEFTGLRLYELAWTYDLDGGTDFEPDKRILIAEVREACRE